MDHINSCCNVVNTKESYVEVVRIIQSETTIHPIESTKFRLFQPESYVSGLYNLKSMCNPDYKIRTASESFGRWSAPHRTRLSIILVLGQDKKTCFYTFFYRIKCRYTPCNHSFSINSLPNHTISHTILSHPLLLFLLQPWFSIVGLS